jgi:aminoglycoside phosphotransferase family enzyme/predicted kinase
MTERGGHDQVPVVAAWRRGAMHPEYEQDQQAVFTFLAEPKTHGCPGPVIRIDTHGAVVFLAGPDVYKVKRAIRFPFMDFSTLGKRRAACLAEIAVNRANAPELYLGAVPITRDAAGIHLDGPGETVEWAVHMRRFDENATLDHVAARGPLGPALVDTLAQTVLAAHLRAPVREAEPATGTLRRLLCETVDELAERDDLFAAARVARYGAALADGFAEVEPLLRRRGGLGQVRRCHGDLHLANLVLIDGEPVVFDGIEFNESIAVTDVLYDLAFLVMDLSERGLDADANRLLNRYIAWSSEAALQIEGLAAFPVFLSLRAAIRAKVTAARARLGQNGAELRADAQGYFEAAIRFLAAQPPRLIAIGGLSGTGKTSLAAALAPHIGRTPGALHLRSDVERKRLCGVPETKALPPEAYRPEVSARVYRRLLDLADRGLRAGQAVILDAVFGQAEDRSAAAAVAARLGVPFCGFWLEAPEATLMRRVGARRGDASDATTDIVAAQVKSIERAPDWRRLEADRPIEALAREALTQLQGRAGAAA